MKLRLIVNADDLGMTPGVTQGIVESMTRGVVTSTTLMANMPSAPAAAELARQHKLAVGVHLNLTTGRPILAPEEVPSLVRVDGTFYPHDEFVRRMLTFRVRTRDIERELEAQILAAQSMGLAPTHIDTHHHTHLLRPVAKVLVRVGRKFDIRKTRTTQTGDMVLKAARRRDGLAGWLKRRYKNLSAAVLHRWFRTAEWRIEPSTFRGMADGDHGSILEEWLRFIGALGQLPDGTTVEVPVHPAYVDEELERTARYVIRREDELLALTSPELRAAISRAGIRLISFREL